MSIPVLSVSDITAQIKNALEMRFRGLCIEGEISNIRSGINASGHIYFTLKDAQAQLSTAFFAGAVKLLPFPVAELKDGLKIKAYGDISVFAPRGSYQLIIRKIEKTGAGDLMAQFEELKKKLQAEGLFDSARKRPLPVMPQRIGIVTSPTGAVIRDMLTVTRRRFPNLHILLAPVKVQGDGAAQEIAAAIDLMGALPPAQRPEVLIVGRGGGSIEDLWCFNEEIVARAVHRSAIPIISAVGHEIDYTICDFVADLRAPTPSAAAELVIGRKDELLAHLASWDASLKRSLTHAVALQRSRLDHAKSHRVFSHPQALLHQHGQHLDLLDTRMKTLLGRQTLRLRQHLDNTDLRARNALTLRMTTARSRLATLKDGLRLINPLATLSRGFGITRDPSGAIVTDPASLSPGTPVTTQLEGGVLHSTVL
ncbi:MAG: exodeoxyribonuclease VII large subunit [Kiritimatiellaeota bacterium]|nr:exodeoxyribonuclease VII large subunit [Kiritimatiellota bacterium]